MAAYTQERVELYKNNEASAEGTSTRGANISASVRTINTYSIVTIFLVVNFVG